ncbi:hypothetical protein IC229_01720 [Spirosoma sp. BT702]|uniref:Uncharacterized protein n=1 Tax=Spirosoma profusum TaxID=2771354 RepID=A0A926Y043_9BACT|nr:hypothetical protein [Spirosoma profusum]MBD2699336.1 hypothetical protein [Spirosoma profusum]
MKRAVPLSWLIGLMMLFLWAGCSKPAEVNGPVTSIPNPTTPATSVRLKQLQIINRVASFVDYTYDAQGRQESVQTYSQRSGEGKDESPATLVTYDSQNRLLKTEDGWFTLDPTNHSVTKKLVTQWQEFAHQGVVMSIKTFLVDPTAYNNSPEITIETNAQGQIVKQVQKKADGSTVETTYQYDRENVVQGEQMIRSSHGAIKSRSRSLYIYDTNPNPLRGLLGPYGGLNVQSYTSKNNVTKWTSQGLSPDTGSVLSETTTYYDYSYSEKGWPVSYETSTAKATYIYY